MQVPRPRRPRSLAARLVLTLVGLAAVVALLLGVVTTLAMRSYLVGQLDDEVRASVERATRAPQDGLDRLPPPGVDLPDPPDVPGQQVGTLTAWLYPDHEPGVGDVVVDTDEGAERTDVSAAVLEALADVPPDGDAHEVSLPGLGEYRVAAITQGGGPVTVAGLPTGDVDDTVASLVRIELVLMAAAVAVAAGAGTLLVRRQLRPLTEVARTAHAVAALPLDSGEIGVTERVPERLTDPRTEVGQVGASLNTLLAHVEDSLDARHASEQQVRQFVADASHELRTPLTTIAGYTELARRRDDPEATATALAKVEEEAGRMTALVEDLLLLARLDAGRPLERRPVDLTRLLLEAVEDARVVGPDHRWRLVLPDDAAVEVVGDERRLHQVVTNLLANARKHTPAGSTVTVTARPGGFEVADDGPGLPAELVDVAFDRFTRGDAARHRVGGAGLGLALVRAIVTAHGGTVGLRSAPGDTRIAVALG